MLMCAIILKVTSDDVKFINIACINIVVASNAGGAFSPFGDITTLMVWQAGLVHFDQFFALLVPAIVNFAIPAVIFSLFISNEKTAPVIDEFELKRGAKRIVGLFILTIITAVLCHSLVNMPPVLGMMTGLGYLKFFGFYLRKSLPRSLNKKRTAAELRQDEKALERLGSIVPFDIFNKIARAEWDTLLFFYGVVMFAVLSMSPDMGLDQWLLVTMTAGVGGSLLSVGSAAGVAFFGHANGKCSFMGHLKWRWAIALGYAGRIYVHFLING